MGLRTRTLPILAGIGCLAVIACTAIFWEDIMVRYHLHRLRGEPDYLVEILDRPEGTAQRAAVRQYLKSEKGKNRLMRLVLGWYPDGLKAMRKPKTVRVIMEVGPGPFFSCWSNDDDGGLFYENSGSTFASTSLPQAISEILPGTEKGDQPWTLLSESQGFRFQLRKGALEHGDISNAAYTCIIERILVPDTDPTTASR